MYLGEKGGFIMVRRPVLPCVKTETMATAVTSRYSREINNPEKKLHNLIIDYTDYRNYQALLNYIKAGGRLDIQLDHSYQLTTPLCEASKRYDTCAMNSMFEEDVDVNFTDGYGNTPLFLAAKCHKIGSVYILLQKGANPDISNRWGKTALTVALENFSNHCAELLVDAGASVNIPIAVRRGITAIPGDATSPLLFILLFSPSPFPMAKKLIDAGALAETISAEAISIVLNRPGTNRKFLELLFAAGFQVKCKQWMKERDMAVIDGTISNRDVEFLDVLKEQTSAPTSLQSIARAQIRTSVTHNKSVKGHIKNKIDQLLLPKCILRYLKLELL